MTLKVSVAPVMFDNVFACAHKQVFGRKGSSAGQLLMDEVP